MTFLPKRAAVFMLKNQYRTLLPDLRTVDKKLPSHHKKTHLSQQIHPQTATIKRTFT